VGFIDFDGMTKVWTAYVLMRNEAVTATTSITAHSMKTFRRERVVSGGAELTPSDVTTSSEISLGITKG
jgi:hypothetical protein